MFEGDGAALPAGWLKISAAFSTNSRQVLPPEIVPGSESS